MKYFVLLLLLAAGCERPLEVHPTQGHFYLVPAGSQIQTVNNGIVTTTADGAWMSEFYLNEMWNAELEDAKEQ